jgi:hypothetical protein
LNRDGYFRSNLFEHARAGRDPALEQIAAQLDAPCAAPLRSHRRCDGVDANFNQDFSAHNFAKLLSDAEGAEDQIQNIIGRRGPGHGVEWTQRIV